MIGVRITPSIVLYEKLDWDTNFFKFPVAKIIPDKLNFSQLQNILNEMKHDGIKLVYWASDPNDRNTQKAAERASGVLVDRKITYVLSLKNLSQKDFLTRVMPEEYLENIVDPGLENLALQSGEHSRFRVDPRIGKEKCKELYLLWMTNSVNRTAAKSMLVIREKGQIVGVVSMDAKNGRGNIGTIIVDKSMRGRGLGADLLKEAHRWFVSNGYDAVQAITQGGNTGAARFYEKFGYTIEKIENYYHFWL